MVGCVRITVKELGVSQPGTHLEMRADNIVEDGRTVISLFSDSFLLCFSCHQHLLPYFSLFPDQVIPLCLYLFVLSVSFRVSLFGVCQTPSTCPPLAVSDSGKKVSWSSNQERASNSSYIVSVVIIVHSQPVNHLAKATSCTVIRLTKDAHLGRISTDSAGS